MKIKLLVALLASSLWCGLTKAQDNWAYNFVTTGTRTPGISFANSSLTAFAISWDVSGSVLSCAVQVDSSADGVSWGSGDLIATQNCAVVGSVAATSLATGKNFVRVNVTGFNGPSGGLNVRLRGYAGAGGSSSSSSLPWGSTIYESTSCPANTPSCFQVFADVHASVNAVYTAASTSVSTAATDIAFVAGDAGKIEFGAGNCPGTVSNCTYDVRQGTIVTVNSAHNVTVSIAATNSNSGVANANNFFWGHDDGAQHVAAFAALFPNTFSGSLIPEPTKALLLACGISFTSLQPFITSVTTSSNGGGLSGCGSGGSTVIVPLPKMNCNATGACLFADNVNFNLENVGQNLPGWHIRDITFWGGGTNVHDASATYSTNIGILIKFTDTLDNVWLIGWTWNEATTGIRNQGGMMISSGSVAGGTVACSLGDPTNGDTVTTMTGGSCGGSGASSMNLTAGTVQTSGVYFNQNFVSGPGIQCLANTTWIDIGSDVTPSYGSSGAQCYASLHGTKLNQHGGGNSVITISAGVIHLAGVSFTASGAPINQTGGTIYDDCGNGALGGTTPVISNLYGDCSITGIADVAGNHVLTSGWGTANVNTLGGSVRDVRFTISITAGVPAAGPVLTDTFAAPFWGTPTAGCTLIQTGGTFGVLSNPLPSALSRTGVAWTFTGTPVSGQSYIFSRHCANS